MTAAELDLVSEAAEVLLGLSLSSRTEGLPAREAAARLAEQLREVVLERESRGPA